MVIFTISNYSNIIKNIIRYKNNLNELQNKINDHKESLLHNHNHLMNFDLEDYWVKTLCED